MRLDPTHLLFTNRVSLSINNATHCAITKTRPVNDILKGKLNVIIVILSMKLLKQCSSFFECVVLPQRLRLKGDLNHSSVYASICDPMGFENAKPINLTPDMIF